MVGQINHVKSITVADDPSMTGSVRPSDWMSAHSLAVTLSGNTIGGSTVGGTNIVLAGGANITLSADTAGGKIVLSGASQSLQSLTINLVGNTAGNPNVAGNPVVLAGGQNITLSGGANGLTIDGPASPVQSNQTVGLGAVGNTTGGASSGTADARSLTISAAGILSAGLIGASLVLSVPASASQTVQAESLTLSGNTLGASNIVGSPGIVIAGGSNITLSGQGATITVVGPSVSTASQSNQTVGEFAIGNTVGQSSSTTADARSFSVSAAGLVSAGFSAGALVISAPASISQSVQTLGLYGSSNTTGQASSSTVDARSLTVEGAGGVSVGMSQGSLVISGPQTVAQSNQTIGAFAGSNTTGQSSSSTVDARSLSFAGAGAASVGMSNGSIVVSVGLAGQTAQTLGLYGSSNTTGQSSSSTVDARSLTIEGAGGISVGMSAGSLVLSGPQTVAQTAQTIGLAASGNTTGQSSSSTVDARSLTVAASGLISAGLSNGSLVLSVTSPAQSNQTEGFYALGNTTGQSTSTSLDARTHSISGAGGVSVGMSAGQIVISAPNTVAQTVQSLGLFASSQTTGQSSASTVDARSLTLVGQGGIAIGFSQGSVLFSASAGPLGFYGLSNTTGQSSSTTIDGRSISIAGAGIVSVGMSGGSVLVSANPAAGDGVNVLSLSGNTSGTLTSYTSATVVLAGGNGITLSQSSNSVTISAANQSAQTIGAFASNNTTVSSSSTLDARSLTIDARGIVSAGLSAGKLLVSATQSAQTVGVFALSRTTGQSSSSTIDARSLSFNFAGIASGGMSGGSIVISVPAAAADGVNIVSLSGNTTGTLTSFSTGTVVLAGGNNVTLSQSSNSITVSGAAFSTMTQGNMVTLSSAGSSITVDAKANIVSASGNTTGTLTSFSSGTIVIAGGSNITLSQSSNTITIIGGAGGGGGGGTNTIGMSNLGNSAGTTGVVSGSAVRAVIVGGQNITVSQSINGSSVTMSVVAPALTQLTAGNMGTLSSAGSTITVDAKANIVSASGNTAGTLTTFSSGTVVLAGGANITLRPSSNSISIIGGAGGGGGGNNTLGMSNLGNTAGTSGVVSGSAVELFFAGGNGITLSQSINGSTATLTVSAANQTAQTIGVYGSSQTVGQSSSSTVDARSFTHVGQGIVSVGMSAGSLLISATTAAQTNQTIGVFASSQTTGQSSSSTLDARSLSVVGAGIVSAGLSAGSLIISATTNQSVQQIRFFASSQTIGQSSSSGVDARSVTFVGQGLVSVGLSGGSILMSVDPTENLYAVGNTTGQSSSSAVDLRTISIQGAGNVSVGMSAGSLVISGAGAGAGATNTFGVSNLGNTAGTSGVITGTGAQLVFAGGNNVTLSQSINGSSATITVSAASQSNQTLGRYAIGNTTGQSSSTTADARTGSFAGAGMISLGFSSNSGLIISATQSAQTVGVYGSSQTIGQSSSSTVDARSLTLVGQGVVSVGLSGGSVLISAPAAAGDGFNIVSASGNTTGTLTTFSSGTVVLAGGQNITMSQSSNSISINAPALTQLTGVSGILLSSNGSTISIYRGNALSQFEPFELGNNTALTAMGQSSLYLDHAVVPENMSVCREDRVGSLSLLLSYTGRTNSSGSWSNAYGYTETVGFYTRGTGASSTALFSAATSSWSVGVSNSASVNSGGATTCSISVGQSIAFISQIGTDGAITQTTQTFSGSSSSAASSLTLAAPMSNVTGLVQLPIPFGTVLSGGEYWFGFLGVSSSTSASTNVTAASFSQAVMQTAAASNLKMLGQTATNTSNQLVAGHGAYSAQTGAFASKIAISEVNNNSQVTLYFNARNVTL